MGKENMIAQAAAKHQAARRKAQVRDSDLRFLALWFTQLESGKVGKASKRHFTPAAPLKGVVMC